MRPIAAAVLWLGLCASALAQTTAVIEGPNEKPAGALVMLKADKSQADRLYWVLCNGPGDAFASVEGGRICFFSWHVPGEYKFLLIAITPSAPKGQEVAIAEKVVKLIGPAPPNPNPPGPNPPNPPGPAPIPIAGFRVLVVSERTGQPLPSGQQAILASAIVREELSRRCAKGSNGVPEFRFFDPDADLSNQPDHWKAAMKLPRQSLPWVIVSTGDNGFSGPLPTTVDEFLALLKRY